MAAGAASAGVRKPVCSRGLPARPVKPLRVGGAAAGYSSF